MRIPDYAGDEVAEAVVATFGSHPEVNWVQVATNEARAAFVVEGDTVLVNFRRADAARRVGGLKLQFSNVGLGHTGSPV
jgi:hypothetical protein